MKPVIDVVDAFERRLRNTWHLSVAGDTSSWPYRHPLGRPDSQTMLRDFGTVQRWVFDLDEWATGHGLNLEWERRRSGSTSQPLPTHVVVPDADTAARVVGQGWTQRLARGRARFGALAAEFPDATLPRVVREVDDWSQVDFGLLVVAAHWFQRNPASGRSPRQVPIEGLHSKWLNTHRPQVATLAGVEDLGLVEPRTTPIAFTYLDRMHRESGGRLHDSVIPGDPVRPAYTPRLAVIAENKDTAILFPEVADAIAVQGGGKAGPALISQIGWMRGADRVVYWGDLDADGFEIVNSYRANGTPVDTILMDLVTLAEYRRFEATTDAKGRPLVRANRKDLPHLTAAEREAYEAIVDPAGGWPMRVEQERIPLEAALAELEHTKA